MMIIINHQKGVIRINRREKKRTRKLQFIRILNKNVERDNVKEVFLL